jgi:hypothetical protein
VFRKGGGASLLFFSVLSFSSFSPAATRNILVTGFWPPTNSMLTRLSPNPSLNPQGWLGKNWENSGLDIYAYFPQFPDPNNSVGVGDFPVDYAGTFNDFFKYTDLLNPVAIVSFGNGPGWQIEKNYPPYFADMFKSDQIPSFTSIVPAYPVPETLKAPVTYHSSLPMEAIASAVNALGLKTIHAYINETGDAGNYLCGFISYLEGWYHTQHSNPIDPSYNAMSGFTHVSSEQVEESWVATEATLREVVKGLRVHFP